MALHKADVDEVILIDANNNINNYIYHFLPGGFVELHWNLSANSHNTPVRLGGIIIL